MAGILRVSVGHLFCSDVFFRYLCGFKTITDMTITLLTLLLAAAGFVWGRIRADVVALIALLILSLSGVLTVGEALSGFSNPIVIMMTCLFVVGGGIFKTGLAKKIGSGILRMAGDNETRLFVLVIAGTALIGAFVSNTGTVALMMPIVVSMAAQGSINSRRLLMPLAFASSMGGMLTLIGTPPNLVISEVWEEAGNGPLSFFSFMPAGLICLVAGTLLLMLLSRLFLSSRQKGGAGRASGKSLADLVAEYDLNSSLRRIDVAPQCGVVGKSLVELNLRGRYGVDVLEVRRGEKSGHILRKITNSTPDPTAPLEAGETLYVRGDDEKLRQLCKDFGLRMSEDDTRLKFYDIGIAEIIPMPHSSIIGKTVAQLDFRNRFGVNVIGIRRQNDVRTVSVGNETLQPGDVMLVQGPWKAIGALSAKTRDWVVLGQPLTQASDVTLDYRAPVAALIMAAMVVALIFDIVPPVISVMTASVLMLLCGCFRSVEEAYRTINWESVVLIAAMMPMSFALEKTGVSAMVASGLASSLGSLGPVAILAGIYVTTSVMTLFISNTATAVLMAPIALGTATSLGLNPLPFLFAVTYAASLCFASPFSTPPNALVMPAGQYTTLDYLKVGLPLQLLLGVLMVFVLPLIFPF